MLTPSEWCDSLQSEPMGIRGHQHTPLARIETTISGSGGAECGALLDDSTQSSHSGPAINELIRAWPDFSDWEKWQVLERVKHNADRLSASHQ